MPGEGKYGGAHVAYRDWEEHLRKRDMAATGSGAALFLRATQRGRLNPPIGRHWFRGRPTRRGRRSHPSVGLRWLQHQLNALHLMAVMVRWGVPRPWALRLARRWERASRAWLYTANPKA
jgi:hypothetical protein